MKAAVSRLFENAAHLAGHEGPVTHQTHFFEDVLLEADSPVDDRGIFQIAAPVAREILHTAGLIARFAGLFNHRHDVLHTLAAWWREHEPDRREVPFAEIAGDSPLWTEFLRFQKTAEESRLSTFDPLRTEALGLLLERRHSLLSRHEELLAATPGKDRLPVHRLEELLDPLPRRYAPLLGASAFVQPLDASGSSWVFNNLYEGTGRYLSRVTPVMEKPLQRRFLDHLAERSVVDLEEEADLLEVKYPWSHLLRAHPPPAAKVLDLGPAPRPAARAAGRPGRSSRSRRTSRPRTSE